MKFASSTFGSSLKWVLSVAVLSSLGCASHTITSVDPCIEIPFTDGAEGACTNTISHKPYLVNATDWAKLRPTMIMFRASDWTKIKLDWLRACRNAKVSCEVYIDSVDAAVKALNEAAAQLYKP